MPRSVRGGMVAGYREAFPPDPDMEAWAAQVVTDGGTVSEPRKLLVTALISGLKSDGLWAKLDRFWIFAAENTFSALRDMKALALASEVSSPTFTADDGYLAAVSGARHLNANYNPATQGVTFTLNSCHIGGWIFTGGSGGFSAIAGASDGTQETTIAMGNPAGTSYVAVINNLAAAQGGLGTAGHVVGTRTASTTCAIFQNAANKGTNATASTAIVNMNQLIGAENTGGGPSNQSDHLISAIHYGGGLNDSEVTAFFNRMRTYMTAVGVP